VHTAVEALGYSQNRAARNLALGRSSMLGLIVSDIRNPFFPEITAAFQDQALVHGMEALVLNTNYDTQRTVNAVKRLIELQVRGVAILTSQIDPAVIEELAARRVAAVYLDVAGVGSGISNIAIDYESGIAQVLDHLCQLGHRRIGYIGGPPHLESAERRRQAFVDTVRRQGLAMAGTLDSDFTVKGGYFACAKLLASVDPTAIVAGNDLSAIGALHCAFDRGYQVPRDLSIAGFDDITFAEYTQPSLTTVAVPRDEIGRVAFQALWQMFHDPAVAGAEYRLHTRLIARQSTASARKE
jgi:LacI family transcriptional regulator